MLATAGCVSVEPAPPAGPAGAPATAPGLPGDPGLAPQIVDGPARDALEAALPPPRGASPAPPSPAASPAGERPAPPRTIPAPPGPAPAARPPVPPREASPGLPWERETALPALPSLPPRASELCRLGADHGVWHPDGRADRLCRHAADARDER